MVKLCSKSLRNCLLRSKNCLKVVLAGEHIRRHSERGGLYTEIHVKLCSGRFFGLIIEAFFFRSKIKLPWVHRLDLNPRCS